MYVIFRFDDGSIICQPIDYWLISGEEADIYLPDDDPLEFRDGQWRYAGASVEIIEIVPDIRRFFREKSCEKKPRKNCEYATIGVNQ